MTDAVGSDAYLVFERDMADLTDREIQMGEQRSKDFVGFFTTGAFRELCRVTPEDLGLPGAKLAYIEACNIQGRWDLAKWSHPVVYHAALQTGGFELRTLPESQGFPLFETNYRQLVGKFMNGQRFDLPTQKVLPATVPNPVSLDEGRARIASLKAML